MGWGAISHTPKKEQSKTAVVAFACVLLLLIWTTRGPPSLCVSVAIHAVCVADAGRARTVRSRRPKQTPL